MEKIPCFQEDELFGYAQKYFFFGGGEFQNIFFFPNFFPQKIFCLFFFQLFFPQTQFFKTLNYFLENFFFGLFFFIFFFVFLFKLTFNNFYLTFYCYLFEFFPRVKKKIPKKHLRSWKILFFKEKTIWENIFFLVFVGSELLGMRVKYSTNSGSLNKQINLRYQ